MGVWERPKNFPRAVVSLLLATRAGLPLGELFLVCPPPPPQDYLEGWQASLSLRPVRLPALLQLGQAKTFRCLTLARGDVKPLPQCSHGKTVSPPGFFSCPAAPHTPGRGQCSPRGFSPHHGETLRPLRLKQTRAIWVQAEQGYGEGGPVPHGWGHP